jgi:hypothetical protein
MEIMKLELVRDKSRDFPKIQNPLDYTSIRVWHCRYQSLSIIQEFQNAESIEIATYPDPTLAPFQALSKIKSLEIIHLPHVTDLSPLAELQSLETLDLQTLPSSRGFQSIASLAPLRRLTHLRILALRGFKFADASLQPLLSCKSLKEFASGNVFPIEELIRLKASNPDLAGPFFQPLTKLRYSFCQKCGSQKVLLSGVTTRAIFCPVCQNRRVQDHVDQWNSLEARLAA